jgi:hypothetical protein
MELITSSKVSLDVSGSDADELRQSIGHVLDVLNSDSRIEKTTKLEKSTRNLSLIYDALSKSRR